ncbi:Tho complex subunit 7-domain-containing protein [Pseudomassariella vexata]|uniref:Tho complex subunit 7-domain-containing protein n=1 Tax=Pseudomassariella vexata TaxID=1141098 RepID=A0A1Y2DE26_9PEZI|nr:Tho complex subunit 7-domain-containing protein [Pseudomassariella vexata]ORY57499.1 Tho complex subunit 7-domain-containing protein [Pseudomassariella vexata]
MTTLQYGLLDEREEQELHKTRLLNVEDKPFKRVTKRLIAPGAFTNPKLNILPTPPPEAADGSSHDDAASSPTNSASATTTNVTALKEDITLDFAAFDSAIARLQFLATANAAERERYAADRLRILETMDSVRNNNAALRVQLDEAKATLAQRKKFDELADKITSNRMLRTRAEQHVSLAKLQEECEELAKESQTYSGTWRERKEQFDKLVEEGVHLRKIIRDEKEEVERREGMDEDGEDDAGTPSKEQSGNGTPRPGSSSGRTPRPDSPSGGEGLKARPDPAEGFSRSGSQAPSLRAGSSPKPMSPGAGSQAQREEPEEGEDVEMGESTQAVDTPMAGGTSEDTPQITVDAPAVEGEKEGDKMDIT